MDTEFQDCMAAIVRKFPESEEARLATAGEMMQDCTRRERAAEEKPDHDSCWDGFQSIRSIIYFRNIADF